MAGLSVGVTGILLVGIALAFFAVVGFILAKVFLLVAGEMAIGLIAENWRTIVAVMAAALVIGVVLIIYAIASVDVSGILDRI